MVLLYIFGGYILGFLISLILLSKYGGKWGWDHYDPPHESWYDDYSSNASAYVAFSAAWFMFYPVNIVAWGYNQVVSFSKFLINKNK
jgi:hypothetical protein